MEILLVMLLLAGVAWWAILRDIKHKSTNESTIVAPYKLEPSAEFLSEKENVVTERGVPSQLAVVNAAEGSAVQTLPVKKPRKPRTPKADKEVVKPTAKKVAVKKATPPKAVALKAPKSKKI